MKVCFAAIAILALTFVIADTSEGKPGNRGTSGVRCNARKWRGCNIANGQCNCSRVRACTNPFAFRKKRTCKKSLRNNCSTTSCQNGGVCMDVKMQYKCSCAGTGYHGDRCEKPCPVPNRLDTEFWKYPHACINV